MSAGASHDDAAALDAIQRALATPASQAVALAGARRAAARGNTALGELAREREELVGRWAVADRRYAAAVVGTDERAESERQSAQDDKRIIAARYGEIDAKLKAEAPAYFGLIGQNPLSLAEVQRLLAEDEAVLMVLPGEFGTHLITVSRAGMSWRRSDWRRDEVDGAVRRLLWFASADVTANAAEVARWTAEVDGGEGGFDRKTAHALFEQIVAPVERELAGHKRLFVIGGGSLSSLPFAMLVAAAPTGHDDDPAALRATAWLGDRYALTQIPALQSLALLRGGAASPTTGAAPSFLGFGDPALDAAPGAQAVDSILAYPSGSTRPLAVPAELRRLGRIPGTASEIAAMAKVLSAPADRLHLGTGDREAAFRRSPELKQAKIVLLATHGLLGGSLTTVAEPGLVFTPPENPGPDDDGYLTTSEVAGLDMGADWVILSACNTAAGDGTEGAPGLSGLARAFFYAGARNLLVSNWPVRDDVAPTLTVGAIRRALENPGLSRAEALQQAVKAVRDDPRADATIIHGINQTWAHPSAWAPFSLVGDGR